MDPLSAIGAAASIAQLVGLADKAATSAWSFTESIVHAPGEVTRLAEKLERFKVLVEQVQRTKEGIPDFDDIFPTSYRDILCSNLESNIEALQKLQSLVSSSNTISLTTKGRIRWAAVDKRKARGILAEIKDAENSLDAAWSMISVRISSINQTSLAAMRDCQEMLLPQMRNEFVILKQHMDAQHESAMLQMTAHTRSNPMESEKELKSFSHELVRLIEAAVSSGKSHLDVIQDLSTIRHGIGIGMSRVNQFTADPISGRRQTPKLQDPGAKSLYSQYPAVTDSHTFFEVSSSANLSASASTELFNHEMRKIEQRRWRFGTIDSSLQRDTHQPAFDATVTLKSARARRQLRFILRTGLRLVNRHIFQLELSLRQNARSWLSMPWLGCSITTVNIRPATAPIFRACFKWDLESVRYLLETGQASIHDIDDETHRGLLEHVFAITRESRKVDGPRDFKGHVVMEYLLDMGCNPNHFHGLPSSHHCPAVIRSFEIGSLDATSTLISRGADIGSFSANPSSYLLNWPRSLFQQKYQLLKSTGFSDWKVEDDISILHGACQGHDWPAFLFALETVGIDPNISQFSGLYPMSPLLEASIQGHVSMAAALIECGAATDYGDNSSRVSRSH